MCGIAGIFLAGRSADGSSIGAMTDALRHRGPDDEGYLAADPATGTCVPLTGRDSTVPGTRIETHRGEARLWLGHRRLSILDLSPQGHQPMANRDGTIWAVFNGEIYNYVELREELRARGATFRTATDTEVLIAAYEAWGRECLGRLNGMWAFAVYDARERVLFASRDRFGVKPFYYFRDGRAFAFASEIKGLLAFPEYRREINERAVHQYLVNGWEEREEEGFFRNIRELPPAHLLVLDLADGALRTGRYHRLDVADRYERYSSKEAGSHASATRDLVTRAVRIRLRADVPVGSCLSGGLDSSSIVCVINRLLQQEPIAQVGDRQKVFTACYDGSPIDESRWAGVVAKATRTEWIRVFPSARDLLADLEDLVRTQDVPFGSTSIYAQFRVMKAAAGSGVKVLLDGQGGDEVFTGYTPYYGPFFLEMIRALDLPSLARETASLGNAAAAPREIARYLLRALAARKPPLGILRTIRKLVRRAGNRVREEDFLRPDFRRRHGMEEGPRPPESLNGLLAELLCGPNLKTLLRYEDRNSMRFSIEARTPFADDLPLIAHQFSVPSSYKIHAGWSKHLLRIAMDGIVPDEIRWRRDKIGFATPEYDWLQEIGGSLRDYLTPSLSDYLDVERLRSDWSRLLAVQNRQGITTLWRYVNFAVWLKIFGR